MPLGPHSRPNSTARGVEVRWLGLGGPGPPSLSSSSVHGAPGAARRFSPPLFPLLPSPTAPMGSATLRRPPPSRSASFLPLSAAHRLPSPPHDFAWCPSLSHLADSGETGRSASRRGRPWQTRGRASAPALSCLLLAKSVRAIRSRAWRTCRLGPWVL